MHAKKLLLVMLLSFFGLADFGRGYAQEELTAPTKIYISPDRIFFYPEGIFYLNASNELSPAQFVGSDSFGIYMYPEESPVPVYLCPYCKRVSITGYCRNRDCSNFGQRIG